MRAPEEERVVDAEEQKSGDADDVPVARRPRQRHTSNHQDRKKHGDRDHQPDRRETHRRQVTKPELDEQPDAAPDQARDPPGE